MIAVNLGWGHAALEPVWPMIAVARATLLEQVSAIVSGGIAETMSRKRSQKDAELGRPQ
jgi:hypothetical protein